MLSTASEPSRREHGACIRLVIVESRTMVREALAYVLAAPEFVTATDPGMSDRLDVTLGQHHPDVVIAGIDPGFPASFALIRQLAAIARQWRTLVLTAPHHPTMHARVIELGAMGMVTLDEPAEVLLKAVRKIAAGELWLDRVRAAGVVSRLRSHLSGDDENHQRIRALTRRERDIVNLITEGLTNKLIAGRLSISEATVRNHLTSVLDKLDLPDRFQLAVFAFRRGLVACPDAAAFPLTGFGWDVESRTARPSRVARPRSASAG
jgi:DNA-binding NarL/FixJ family response regulator